MLSKLRIAAAATVAAIGLLPALAGPAAAQAGVQVGTLTCNASGSFGFIFGSTKALACTFSGPGRVEYYRGDISKFGVDIGYTQGGILVWTVFAPTATMAPGDLSGTYGGATASATVGVGVGANALIGGSGNHIALQPLSIEANRGLNVAAGVASMTLSAAR
jgi:Protein of unknown function (DUF992)